MVRSFFSLLAAAWLLAQVSALMPEEAADGQCDVNTLTPCAGEYYWKDSMTFFV